jgi:hypothetical protein
MGKAASRVSCQSHYHLIENGVKVVLHELFLFIGKKLLDRVQEICVIGMGNHVNKDWLFVLFVVLLEPLMLVILQPYFFIVRVKTLRRF